VNYFWFGFNASLKWRGLGFRNSQLICIWTWTGGEVLVHRLLRQPGARVLVAGEGDGVAVRNLLWSTALRRFGEELEGFPQVCDNGFEFGIDRR